MDLSFNPQPPTGNPLLDNPIAKDMLTRQMAQQQAAAQPQGAIMPAGGATPPPSIHPSGQPVQSAPPPMIQPASGPHNELEGGLAPLPKMTTPAPEPPPASVGAQKRLSDLQSQGSGVSQIAHKIEGTQFGQNHPTLGKILGLGAQIPLQVLDSIAGAASPILRNIETGIPGTEEHHNLLVNQAGGQVKQDVANEEKQAQTGATQAEIPLRGAETAKAQTEADALPGQQAEKQRLEDAQIQNLLHPQAKTAFEDWRATNPNAPTADFFKAQQEAKPEKDANLPQQYMDALAKGDTATADRIKQTIQATSTQPKIDVHTAEAAGRPNPAVEREYTVAAGALNKQFESAQKQRDAIDQASTELAGGAVGQALGTVKTLVGLAGGQGSGVRVTQAELNSILHARGIQGDFSGWVSKIEGEGALDQKKQLPQIQALLHAVDAKLKEKEAMYDTSLDKLSGAQSTQEIRKIQSDFRKSAISSGGTENNASGPKVGDSVKLKNGQTIKVKVVHPDGSFE